MHTELRGGITLGKSFNTSRSKDEANLRIADATLITHGELNRDLFFIDDYSVTHRRPSCHVEFNLTEPLQGIVKGRL